MGAPWFRKRVPDRGSGYGIGSWQGWVVVAIYVFVLIAPPLFVLLASGNLVLFLIVALGACGGGTLWLMRMIRAHSDG